MNKCANPGCNGTATKDSALCLTHAIEAHGGLLLGALEGVWAGTTPPPETGHDELMAKVKEGETSHE